MSRSGIVNVRMVITEEKILSNIDKVQKLINPKSKKQIVQLEDDTYFKDLVESIKTYLIEYPKKKNFPPSVYKAAYGLVEFATNQFEENTKKIEELIRQREENIALAGKLKEVMEAVENKEEDWKDQVKAAEEDFSEDIIEPLNIIGKAKGTTSQNYQDAMKLLKARVNNLESNLHIEIDMERIEDKSKALSYIGIEIADALKSIPTPVEEIEEQPVVEQIEQVQEIKEQEVEQKQANVQTAQIEEQQQYNQEMTFETKPSLWQRFKNSKFVRAIKAVTRIRIVLDYSDALPEGRGENKQ
ncbi:MAG: hypothetical protein EGQ16_03850 [Clostridiales bacterium]|nr:hypothetical protein [Clostridiales bacterium]MBD9158954.1 hypothetical protein [Clostridiales bacterium]